MESAGEIANLAIKAFDSNDMTLFDNYSKAIFNHFNVFPTRLLDNKNNYLIGTVYSYLEGALRDLDDIHRVCFENACYCFSKTIKSDKIYERQGAAIRLFLLFNDVSSAAFDLCFNILKEDCLKKNGMTYEQYLLALNNDKSAILGEVRHYVKQIKSYCYSVFAGHIDHAFIDTMNMNRIKAIVSEEDYTETPPILGYKYTNSYFFDEFFYKYLLSEIGMEKGLRASRMTSI